MTEPVEVARVPPTQLSVLTRRYLACMLGDPVTVVVLLAQAPLIGWLCTVVWGAVESDTPSLRFVLCLSALWFGCIDACREIVKERRIVERERFFGLSLRAYVLSKLAVLGGLGFAQVLLLQLAVEWKLALNGAFLLQTLALAGAAACGVGLGLFVSALSRTQDRAVGVVPLLIIPQILFSEFSIPESAFSGVIGVVQKAMPVYWAYEVFEQGASTEASWSAVIVALVVLPVYALGLGALTTLALVPRREVQ